MTIAIAKSKANTSICSINTLQKNTALDELNTIINAAVE
jgi:hypothetical protein